MNRTSRNSGVTLLELAIVLAIIAVIAASVLVGRAMLENSRLQTVMTDADHYIKATGQFKEAYQALPGDLPTAATLWGTDSNGCPSGGGATGTCNGNGDGRIGAFCSGGSVDTTQGYESFRAWQQLSSANLVLSSLTPTGTALTFTPGTNVPRTSIDGAGFALMWVDDPTVCSNNYGLIPNTGRYGNILMLGSGSSAGILLPRDAAAIDQKIDDAVPGTGFVRGPGTGSQPNCVSSATAYNVTYSSKACSLLFLTDL